MGYHQWRDALAAFHAEQASIILAAAGYGAEIVEQVSRLTLRADLLAVPTD